MLILAIETSCDDTACAVVKISGTKNKRFKILSSVVSSQTQIHAPYGGVVPTLAARAHKENLPIVFEKALKEAKTKIEKIDYIAVTKGPGLVIALWTGVNFAKELAKKYKKEIIPVNHIAGHIYSNFIELKKEPKFPLLNIVVSGGHTELVLMNKLNHFKIIGETRDDAAGEAFDKTARMLGLPYPGGPIISKLALQGDPNAYALPRPMIHSGDLDFSFSGLKTSVLYALQKNPEIKADPKLLSNFCASIEQAIVDTIVAKTISAAKKTKANTIALAGGVSANKKLRETLKNSIQNKFPEITFLVPPLSLSMDNAVMIAIAAAFSKQKPTTGARLSANANWAL